MGIGFRLALLGAVAVLLALPGAGAWRDANRNGTMEPYEDPAQAVAVRVDDLLSRMTPVEKAGQLNLPYWSPGKDNSDVERRLASGGVGGLLICAGTNPAKANELQRLACERSRLGVPGFNGQDIIHGASVTFPISPFLAGAFEPELFERAQTFAARDAAAEGITVMFAPMSDVARENGVGILLISADFDEILEMSDRILVFFEGKITGEFSGKNPPVEEISLAMTGKRKGEIYGCRKNAWHKQKFRKTYRKR